MKKDAIHKRRIGWVIFDPSRMVFYKTIGNTGAFTETNAIESAYFFSTRNGAAEVAKGLGKGRSLTIARAAWHYVVDFRGAIETKGTDARNL